VADNIPHKTAIEDEGTFVRADRDGAYEQAIALHRLATADPEFDGVMPGPAHEKKYGLEREQASAAAWRSVGVNPYENGALKPGEEGFENIRGIETASAAAAPETAAAPRPAPAPSPSQQSS